MTRKYTDFPTWFITQCVKVDYLKSDKEERKRYENLPPYHYRITKWIDKFYRPFKLNKDGDERENS